MQNHTEHTDDEELKAHLLRTDPNFRALNEQHIELKGLVDAIESKPHITEADELEEQRLKKLKLAVKDQMNEIMSQQKHASAV